jgi:hypothetical protein
MIPTQFKQANIPTVKNSRFFNSIPETNIQTIRTGPKQTNLEMHRLGGTGKYYPWSQLRDQLSRGRFKPI